MESLQLALQLPVYKPAQHTNVASPCRDCGLYNSAQTYNMQPVFDQRSEEEYPQLKGAPTILVVDRGPSWYEDVWGESLQLHQRDSFGNVIGENRISNYILTWLNNLEVRWIYDRTTRCYAGRDAEMHEVEPTIEQTRICVQHFLSPQVAQHDVKAIVCLGLQALTGIWGPTVKSIRSFGISPRKHESGVWVLGLPHPYFGEMQGYATLDEQYQCAFEMAEELALGKSREPVTYRVINDAAEAMQYARLLPYHVAADCESNVSDASKTRRTMWHEDARMLCYGIAYRDKNVKPGERGSIKVISLRQPLCNDPKLIRAFFTGRRVTFHAIKADVQMFWRLGGGVCLWKIAKEPVCTLQKSSLRDQSRAGNGLKELSMRHFHVPDWSGRVWEQVAHANDLIVKRGKELMDTIRAQLKLLRHKREVSLVPSFYKNGKPYNKKVYRVLDRAELLQLRAQKRMLQTDYARLMPDKGFEVADQEDLALYNAHDVTYTLRLDDEWFPNLPEWDRPSDLAYRLGMRISEVTTYIERVGIPIDKTYYRALRRTAEAKIEEHREALLGSPYVWAALSLLPDVQDLAKRGRLTKRLAAQYVNVKSINFFTALVSVTCTPQFIQAMPRTETGLLQSNWPVLDMLCGDNPRIPPEQRLPQHWVWYCFTQLRELRDMCSKFFSIVEEFAVDEGADGLRIHTDYNVARVEIPGRESGADRGGGTSTGRISSREPNAQNLKKDPIQRTIIRAPRGRVIGEIDFSSIEPVCLAVETGCKAWLRIFERGLDLYRCVANDARKMGLSLDGEDEEVQLRLKLGVPKSLRNLSKVSTLAKMYREAARAMARRMGISEEDAVIFAEGFDKAYPEIKEWQDDLVIRARRGDKIATRFGRYRTFPFSGIWATDDSTERQLVNYPIQSLASDINLWQAWELHYELERHGYARWARIFNVVHDSIALEIDSSCWVEVMAFSQKVMSDRSRLPFPFPCPIRTSGTVGTDMGAMLLEDELVLFNGLDITPNLVPSGWTAVYDESRERMVAVEV